MSTGLHSTTSSVQASSILNDLNYAQINLPIITTEEEFKKYVFVFVNSISHCYKINLRII